MKSEVTEPKLRAIWRVDSTHSSVEFAAKHMAVATVKGRFTDVVGMIVGDLNDPANAQIEVEIATARVDTGNSQRDWHLRSADFLNAADYPTISFRSTKIEPLGEDNFWVRGDLQIRGKAREVNLVGSVDGETVNQLGEEVIGMSAETTVIPKDFGLTWNLPLPAGGWLIGNELRVELHLEAIREL